MWWKACIISSLLISGSPRSLPETTAEREVLFVTNHRAEKNFLETSLVPSRISTSIRPHNDDEQHDDTYPLDHQQEVNYPHEHDRDGITLIALDADRQFEEQLRNGQVDSKDVPRHLLLLDDKGNPVDRPSRTLSVESAKIDTFNRLSCNPISWPDCSTLVSNNLPSGDDHLTIPCGQCYTFDMGGNVTLNGIDIKGKLVFPLNHKAIIYTPFVIVQGELEITVNHAKVAPDNVATRFVLTGIDNVKFTPTDAPNHNVCDKTNGVCDLGVKPFVVVGGKVNINAMPESCSTHTLVAKKVYKDPTYNPEDFPKFVSLPPSCPQSGLSYISYNFDDGYGNWTGRDGTFLRSSHGAVKVSNRRLTNRGPHLDVTPIHPEACLVPNQDYLFVAK
jgi:hypothetical protein